MSDAAHEARLNRIDDRLEILEARIDALELSVHSQMQVVADTSQRLMFDCTHQRLNTAGRCEVCGELQEVG